MGGGVAGLADVLHPPPQVASHDLPEVLGVHEADQPVIVGHDQRAVHGVHPFDGKLHAPAAVQRTGRRIDLIDFFRRNGNLPEGGKLRVGEEKIKVGHGNHLLNFPDFILLLHLCMFPAIQSPVSRRSESNQMPR